MYVYVFVTLGQTPILRYSTTPSPQAENIDVCVNIAPSMLTDNKKKKLATILCPVMIMLVESRFIFICNKPRPLPPPHPTLFWKTSNTHVELFPKFGPQNKFFDNHWNCYSSWTVECGEISEVQAFFQDTDSGEA